MLIEIHRFFYKVKYLDKGYQLITRLPSEGEEIVEVLKEGSALAEDSNLKTSELREGILKDIQTYTKRKFLVDQKIVQCKSVIDSVTTEKVR